MEMMLVQNIYIYMKGFYYKVYNAKEENNIYCIYQTITKYLYLTRVFMVKYFISSSQKRDPLRYHLFSQIKNSFHNDVISLNANI